MTSSLASVVFFSIWSYNCWRNLLLHCTMIFCGLLLNEHRWSLIWNIRRCIFGLNSKTLYCSGSGWGATLGVIWLLSGSLFDAWNTRGIASKHQRRLSGPDIRSFTFPRWCYKSEARHENGRNGTKEQSYLSYGWFYPRGFWESCQSKDEVMRETICHFV